MRIKEMAVARSSPICKERERLQRDEDMKNRHRKGGRRQQQGRQSHQERKIKQTREREEQEDEEAPSKKDGRQDRQEWETVSK